MAEMDMEIESGIDVDPRLVVVDDEDSDYDGDFFVEKGAQIPQSASEIEV